MKDKEIEVKFVINEEIKKLMIADLESGDYEKEKSRLIDTYYVPNFKDFEVNGETMECVRIRETHKSVVLCYKKIHREADPVYCDEYETKIQDKEQMEKILFALGFSVQMVIDKTRESYEVGDWEFDFDTVNDLGVFVEVEFEGENANLEELFEYVKKYGISKYDSTTEGIQTLMKKAKGLK